jgi:hypothetical protein
MKTFCPKQARDEGYAELQLEASMTASILVGAEVALCYQAASDNSADVPSPSIQPLVTANLGLGVLTILIFTPYSMATHLSIHIVKAFQIGNQGKKYEDSHTAL